MPEETITIGGKSFEVACQDGEQHYLHAAARMLDNEARALIDQIGRLPEARMLLMAGLMLADKTAAAEDRIRVLEAELADAQNRVSVAAPAPVAALSPDELERLNALADQAEALANRVGQG